MAEEATRPFDHREVHGHSDDLARNVVDDLKPLLTLAFNGIRSGLTRVRQVVISLVKLLQMMFQRQVGDDQQAGAPNRSENFACLGEQPIGISGPWLRFKALWIGVIALGKPALRIAAEFILVVLILGWRSGRAVYRVVCSRFEEFRRDGKVELSRAESAVTLLFLAFFGFSLAWLVSDSDPRVDRIAGGQTADGNSVLAVDEVHKADPIRSVAPDVPTRQLAELLMERPSLEGRLYWAEQPMPLPVLASHLDSEIGLATTARSMPPSQRDVIEVTVVGAPATTAGASTNERQPSDILPPPPISSFPRNRDADKAQAPYTVPPAKAQQTHADKPSPPLPTNVPVNVAQPKLAVASPTPQTQSPPSKVADSGTTYQVQLVAVGARDQALVMWENLLGKHQDVLGDLDPDISSRRMRNRNLVYRLRAGPLESRNEASALCTALSKRKVDCLVVRASG